MTESRWRSAISVAAGFGVLFCCWSPATAQTQSAPDAGGTIAKNDGIFVDGTTFKITTGKTTIDTSTLIDRLGARPLGPGLLIFRSDDKLYMVGTPLAVTHDPADEARANRVRIEYTPPTNPKHQVLYDLLVKERHPLETVQRLFSPLRLPVDLTVKTVGCDGVSNAWYEREGSQPTVKLCYEYLQEIMDRMPKTTTPEGIEPQDAILGQFFYAVTHELGHALFDIYDIPVFGREEDAADQFAAYVMLQFDKERAHRLIRGASYAYITFIEADKKRPYVEIPLKAFSSNHGAPEERFYNLLCIAYGYDSTQYKSLVEKGYLPETRAKNCRYEYEVLAHAVHHEISPHVDQRMKNDVFATTWFAPPSREAGR